MDLRWILDGSEVVNVEIIALHDLFIYDLEIDGYRDTSVSEKHAATSKTNPHNSQIQLCI